MVDVIDRLNSALADRYAIQRELGQGGMATVYLATDLRHHRDVALKVLRPELAAALGFERFLREIELAARLTHPHILPVHDSGSAGGFLFYVMPYVEGESLRDRLNREKQLPVDDALRISREVADALSYAHAHGAIHRDIKPENILLESGHAVVADFGIARALDQAGGASLTGTGVALGTPAYMSPEQALGSKEVDGRSDLYSLACVLYEMLAGHPPFVGPSVESVTYQHLSAAPPPITSIRPAVPAHLAATLERALAKTPADRFNPVASFAEALSARESRAPEAARAPIRFSASRLFSVRTLVVAGAVMLAVFAGAMALSHRIRGTHGSAERSVAVLPFANLSPDAENAFFADGIHDEILARLARIAALEVRSRTSMLEYRNTSKNVRQIAHELGVRYVLEGGVRRAGGSVRITAQLIDAATDEHLWADTYNGSLEDVFGIQADVAEKIARSLEAELSPAERSRLAEQPTANMEAHDLYMRAREYALRGYKRDDYELARQLLERAVELDRNYALGYAGLSDVLGNLYWFHYDRSDSIQIQVRQAAENAVRLAPESPDAHRAMGMYYYRVPLDYDRALRELRFAQQRAPGDAELIADIAFVLRRQGDLQGAVHTLERAVALDPRSARLRVNLGETYRLLRDYDRATAAYRHATELAPDQAEAQTRNVLLTLMNLGDIPRARALLADLRRRRIVDTGDFDLSYCAAVIEYVARRPDAMIAVLQQSPLAVFQNQWFYIPKTLLLARAYAQYPDRARTRPYLDSALTLVDEALTAAPDDARLYLARGEVLAGLGRSAEAVRAGTRATELMPIEREYFRGTYFLTELARIYAATGQVDRAVVLLARLLRMPSEISATALRLDPRWDPIRNDPRFQALLVKYADPQPVH